MTTNPVDYPFWLRVVVVVTLILFAVNLLFFIGPAIGLFSAGKDLIGPLTTLIAAFSGAWAAFQFAKIHRAKENSETEIAAGNRALFTLSEMWNSLKQHQKEVIAPIRGKPDAWLNLKATPPLSSRSLTFDVKELIFLLRADAATLQAVILEEHRFLLASYTVDQHRSLVLSQVFPRMSAAGINVGSNVPLNQVEGVLGNGVVHLLKMYTDAIVKNVDEDVQSSLGAFNKLRAALKAIYPDQKFIDIKPNE